MKLQPSTLSRYAAEARVTARALLEMADQLDAAACDNISQSDVSLEGLSSAAALVREQRPFLERMG